MSSRNKRGGSGSDDKIESRIEDAEIVSETPAEEDTGDSGEAAAAPRDPGEAPLIAPEDAPADPNPGDGSYFHDRGDVAVDLRADALEGGALEGRDEINPQPEPPGAAAVAADSGAAELGPQPEPPDLETPAEPAAAAQVTAAAPPPPVPPAQSSGGGFWSSVFGGVVAAAVGFGAATWMQGGFAPEPEGPDPVEQALSAQQERLSGLDGQLSALDGRLAEIASAVSAPPDTAGLETRLQEISTELAGTLEALSGRFETVTAGIGGLEETLAGVQERLTAVDERLTEVEKRPLVESSETARVAFEAYERELEELRGDLAAQEERNAAMAAELAAAADQARSEMETVESRAAGLQAEAERTAAQAALREAVARIGAALEAGTPFDAALGQLPDSIEVPEALAANAATGVAALPELRLSFPAVAREALDASIRETVSDDAPGRVMAFLRSQTGARSLAPKEGDDPDAVLSRAEASVRDGDLAAALGEIGALPPAGQAVAADWVARAEARLAVTAGLAEMAAGLQGE